MRIEKDWQPGRPLRSNIYAGQNYDSYSMALLKGEGVWKFCPSACYSHMTYGNLDGFVGLLPRKTTPPQWVEDLINHPIYSPVFVTRDVEEGFTSGFIFNLDNGRNFLSAVSQIFRMCHEFNLREVVELQYEVGMTFDEILLFNCTNFWTANMSFNPIFGQFRRNTNHIPIQTYTLLNNVLHFDNLTYGANYFKSKYGSADDFFGLGANSHSVGTLLSKPFRSRMEGVTKLQTSKNVFGQTEKVWKLPLNVENMALAAAEFRATIEEALVKIGEAK